MTLKFRPLPQIMVAPNGARVKTGEHPSVPVTIPDIVAAALSCYQSGAGGIHAHIRDAEQNHVLDAGLYKELLAELKRAMPHDFYSQITSEAVGLYDPATQRQVMYESGAENISFSIKEMLRDGEPPDVRTFYHDMWDRGTMVQHILYSHEDVERLIDWIKRGIVPKTNMSVLCVLGRYSKNFTSTPADLDLFTAPLMDLTHALGHPVDWACCAFGAQETECLQAAHERGGKARIGFENNTVNSDGSRAHDNAERVKELAHLISRQKH